MDINNVLRESAEQSIRFALHCLTPCDGHLRAISTFVNPQGEPQMWHDFGPLEGPGWAANSLGGASVLLRYGKTFGREDCTRAGNALIEHTLAHFVDVHDRLQWLYRDVRSGTFYLNFKHNRDWFCPGSVARVVIQMLECAERTESPLLQERLIACAHATAHWLTAITPILPNGWFPRRITPQGEPYPYAAEGGNDPIFAESGDGTHLLWMWTELTRREIGEYRSHLRRGIEAFQRAGGFYGSVNHDTYDKQENVAYAIAFRTFTRASDLLGEPALKEYALQKILPGLERFILYEDRNGVATKGLLYMEDSWDTAYLWENAEAALAYLEAYRLTGKRLYEQRATDILLAISKHHHGEHGFLTEGVDWNNHVGSQHHIGQAQYGAIAYTEPLLNNLYHVEAYCVWKER
ncbi:MAG: hypothetical protein KatS3mg022_2433 [Armatimonadota bacterium]|nr:MAG: hypothetical protein KatS3mg022_2433 [Armatimonadota bacterium]